MTKLGKQYGLSDNGLAKICRRLNIPYPGRGYWPRKAAGKHVIIYRLLNAGSGIPQLVTISPTYEPEEPPVAIAQVAGQVESLEPEPAAGPISVSPVGAMRRNRRP